MVGWFCPVLVRGGRIRRLGYVESVERGGDLVEFV
jgi:hypothetical protein